MESEKRYNGRPKGQVFATRVQTMTFIISTAKSLIDTFSTNEFHGGIAWKELDLLVTKC